MNLTDQFLSDIKVFMRKHKMSKTMFGTKSVNDPHAVFLWLEGEREPFMRSVDKVYAFMAKYEKESG